MTRTARLQKYLARRMAARFCPTMKLSWWGTLPAGLDIRWLLWELHHRKEPMVVDGGAKVEPRQILKCVRHVRLLSVPQHLRACHSGAQLGTTTASSTPLLCHGPEAKMCWCCGGRIGTDRARQVLRRSTSTRPAAEWTRHRWLPIRYRESESPQSLHFSSHPDRGPVR